MEYLLILNCLIILFPFLEAGSPRTLPMILPGTQWCGAGNRAEHKDDLGWFEETDKCCKKHDECPLSIGAGDSKFSIRNDFGFTISWCRCDEKFRDCLVDIGPQFVAMFVKEVFFDILTRRCFSLKKGKKPGTLAGVLHTKPPLEEFFEGNGWQSPYDELADLADNAKDIAKDVSRKLEQMGEIVADDFEYVFGDILG